MRQKDTVFASYLIRIVPNKKYIIPKYLSYFFLTPAYWEVVGQNAAGAAQPNINGTKLSEFIVPVAPQGEQKRIVEKLGALLTVSTPPLSICRKVSHWLMRYLRMGLMSILLNSQEQTPS